MSCTTALIVCLILVAMALRSQSLDDKRERKEKEK
jgi:hypothetical protein